MKGFSVGEGTPGGRSPGGCCAAVASCVFGNVPHQAALRQGDLHLPISVSANKVMAGQK